MSALLATCGVAVAVEISSNEPIEYIEDSGALVAKGEARIIYDNFVLQADEIQFKKSKNTIIGIGNVKIDSGKIYAVADVVSCDASSSSVHAEHCRVKVHECYFFADSVDIGQDVQSGSDAVIFFCDPRRKFVPSMAVKHFETLNRKSLRVKNAKLKMGSVPLLRLSSAKVKISERPLSIDQNLSVIRGNGAGLRNDFYVGVSDWLKLGGIFDISMKRGVLAGPALKIDHDSGKNRISSDVKLGLISDRASDSVRGVDEKNRQIERHRHIFKLAHKQHAGDRIDIVSDVSLPSDSEVERDFRRSWYEKNQRPNAFGEVSYRGTNYVASAFAGFEPNNFYDTTQRLPELRVDYLPTKILSTKFIHSAHFSAARLRGQEKLKANAKKISSYRSEIFYGLALPIGGGNFISVKPMVGARGVIYGHNTDGGSHGKLLIQGGVDVNFRVIGRSNYANDAMEINGLKHTFNPMIQYRIIPSGNVRDGIPKLDVEFFNAEIPSIDLGEMRNIDHLKRQNMVRFGVRNNWYTRSESYVPRKLARFDILQDVLFARHLDDRTNTRQKRFQDTHIAAGLYPIPTIALDVCCRIDPAKMHLSELKSSLTVRDGSFWKAKIFSNYSKLWEEKTKQYGMALVFNLSSQTSISVEARYDAVVKKITERRVGISTTLGNSWLAEIGIIARKNAKREDRFQFDWHIRMLDF